MDNPTTAAAAAGGTVASPVDPAKDFKLERYKYILTQINALNENLHKYLTLFQTLATAILSAVVAVVVGWPKLGISASVARLGIRSLLGILVILALFVIFSVLSGMFSWMDYRREEVELLDKEVHVGFRSAPKSGNLWRWYETHALIFILLFVIVVWIVAEWRIMPVIQ
jgi:hypothetical protein